MSRILVVLRSFLLHIGQRLLQPADPTKLHLSFCTWCCSAPAGRHQSTWGICSTPCTGGYRLHPFHGSTTSSAPSCSALTKARHWSLFEMKTFQKGLSHGLCSVQRMSVLVLGSQGQHLWCCLPQRWLQRLGHLLTVNDPFHTHTALKAGPSGSLLESPRVSWEQWVGELWLFCVWCPGQLLVSALSHSDWAPVHRPSCVVPTPRHWGLLSFPWVALKLDFGKWEVPKIPKSPKQEVYVGCQGKPPSDRKSVV